LGGNKRSFSDIEPLIKNDRDKNYDDELSKLNSFFEYSVTKHCFKNNCRNIDRQLLNFGNYKIQINLLNTAPFSSTSADDKRLHHIPHDAISKIERQDNVYINIAIMHHSTEWFCEDTKSKLEETLYKNCEIVFQGHEHKSTNVRIEKNAIQDLRTIRNGEFSVSGTQAEFNVVLLDLEKCELSVYTYQWDTKESMFITQSETINQMINRKHLSLRPSQEFVDNLLSDEYEISETEKFVDFYTFPKLIPKDSNAETRAAVSSVESFFETLRDSRCICIRGDDRSGKTSLLKYLFFRSLEKGFVPLIIGNTLKVDSKIDKLVKQLFENQYSTQAADWDRYRQLDVSRKLVLVDDVEMIKYEKNRELLIKYLSDEFGVIIITTDTKASADLLKQAEQDIQRSEFSIYNMQPMYRGKRTELVKKVCSLKGISEAESEEIANTIDQIIMQDGGIFSLSPEFVLKFLTFYLSGNKVVHNKDSVFGAIFESDIIRTIADATNKSNVDIYRLVLDELAHFMHFNKKIELSSDEIKCRIKKYNERYGERVVASDFVNDILEAKIFAQTDSLNYRFKDKNVLAYFVARCISRNIERNPTDLNDLNIILRDICFGINGTIVLFLSYLRSNVKLIMHFVEQADELLRDIPELNVDDKDAALFLRHPFSADVKMPQKSDHEKANRQIEVAEKEQAEAIVQYRNIYDYQSEDADLPEYKNRRALSCVNIIAKSLISLKGVMEVDDKREIINKIYTLPNKILYAIFSPANEHFDELVGKLTKLMQQHFDTPTIEEDKARTLLLMSAWSLSLGIYDNIAFNCVDSNTIDHLGEYSVATTQQRIQKLIMYEQLGNTSKFIEKATTLYESNQDVLQKYLIRRISRVHVLKHSAIKSHELDRLNSKIFGGQSKRALLTLKGRRSGD